MENPETNNMSVGEQLERLADTQDTTKEYDPKDIEQNKAMAILAYLGILVLIPLFGAKDSKFARFHTNQGLVLCICEIAYTIIYEILTGIILSISLYLTFLITIMSLCGFVFLILAIIGIMNAVKGKAKQLPIIGNIKIMK